MLVMIVQAAIPVREIDNRISAQVPVALSETYTLLLSMSNAYATLLNISKIYMCLLIMSKSYT